MNVGTIQPGAISDAQPSRTPDNGKMDKAAHDFEALLVTEMLRASHGEGGWLGTGDDNSGETAVGMGEEQLAQALANGGGLGLAKMITTCLKQPAAASKS